MTSPAIVVEVPLTRDAYDALHAQAIARADELWAQGDWPHAGEILRDLNIEMDAMLRALPPETTE